MKRKEEIKKKVLCLIMLGSPTNESACEKKYLINISKKKYKKPERFKNMKKNRERENKAKGETKRTIFITKVNRKKIKIGRKGIG
jgi:hypothetical protein